MTLHASISAQEAAALDALLPQPMTQDMRDVALSVCAGLREAGVPHDDACRHTAAVMRRLVADWGGLTVYFAKGLRARVNARNASIWHEFRGDNYRHLALKHGLSLQMVRGIVGEQRRAEFARRQPELF